MKLQFAVTLLILIVSLPHGAFAAPPRAVDESRLSAVVSAAGTQEPCSRTSDVIYGRKCGMALTLDVLTPPKPNGAGVIWAVSGGFRSSHDAIAGDGFVRRVRPLLEHGYTVFAVVHGSMPKFEMREIAADMHRAVRFIRRHADDFRIDPNRLGVSGASAGGHLALWLGTTGKPGDPAAADPVDRCSSRVQAVACFFPGTDWVDFEKPGVDVLGVSKRIGTIESFRFREYDPALKESVLITDPKRVEAILREYSPINRVTRESAPTLIIHGDADRLVPLEQQSGRMIERLKQHDVPARLIVKKGKGHGWANMSEDFEHLARWYDEHLGSAFDSRGR